MPNRLFRRARHAWFSPTRWARRIIFWSGALSVGLIAALFANGSDYAHHAFAYFVGVSPYLPFLITPIGFVLVLYLTRRFFAGSQGSGIPQTIAALELIDPAARGSLLSLRIAAGKIGLTLLALISGASVGREGPTVQIGASILHALGALGKFSQPNAERALIIAGGAAGVAAAFNTPLAGIVFAIEEMSRSLEQRLSGTLLTAVIVAGLTAVTILGNYSYFGSTSAAFSWLRDTPALIVCASAGGLAGGGFSRILIVIARGRPLGLGKLISRHPYFLAAICGTIIAAIGLWNHSTIYGTGYNEAKQILEGHSAVGAGFGISKLAATLLSYISGIPGGLFAPSLAIGAGFGLNLSHLFPMAGGALILITMAAYFSGVVQAPITAFVIVMEMTNNHDLILPLMAAAVIANTVSKQVCPTPLYRALAGNFLAPHHIKPATHSE